MGWWAAVIIHMVVNTLGIADGRNFLNYSYPNLRPSTHLFKSETRCKDWTSWLVSAQKPMRLQSWGVNKSDLIILFLCVSFFSLQLSCWTNRALKFNICSRAKLGAKIGRLCWSQRRTPCSRSLEGTKIRLNHALLSLIPFYMASWALVSEASPKHSFVQDCFEKIKLT